MWFPSSKIIVFVATMANGLTVRVTDNLYMAKLKKTEKTAIYLLMMKPYPLEILTDSNNQSPIAPQSLKP